MQVLEISKSDASFRSFNLVIEMLFNASAGRMLGDMSIKDSFNLVIEMLFNAI